MRRNRIGVLGVEMRIGGELLNVGFTVMGVVVEGGFARPVEAIGGRVEIDDFHARAAGTGVETLSRNCEFRGERAPACAAHARILREHGQLPGQAM